MSVNVEQISVKGNGRILVDLRVGETFIHEGFLYMKTGSLAADEGCRSIVLNDGQATVRVLNPMAIVEPVDVIGAVVDLGAQKKEDCTISFCVKCTAVKQLLDMVPADALGEMIGKQVTAYLKNEGYR